MTATYLILTAGFFSRWHDCNFAVDIKKQFALIFTDFKIEVDFTRAVAVVDFAVDVTQRENPFRRTSTFCVC